MVCRILTVKKDILYNVESNMVFLCRAGFGVVKKLAEVCKLVSFVVGVNKLILSKLRPSEGSLFRDC